MGKPLHLGVWCVGEGKDVAGVLSGSDRGRNGFAFWLLDEQLWVHLVQEVVHDPACHLVCGAVMDVQEIGRLLPEAVDGLSDAVDDVAGLSVGEVVVVVPEGALQQSHALLAGVLCQHLLGDVAVGRQVRVLRLHHLPHRSDLLHQSDDVLPFFGVVLPHRLCPEVRVLVDGRLARGDARVDVDGLVVREAVSVTLRREEEHRLSLHHVGLHLRRDGHGVQCRFHSPSLDVGDLHVLGADVPFLGVPVDELRQHLVVEGGDALRADLDLLCGEGLVVSLQDVVRQFLAHQFLQFLVLHLLRLVAVEDGALLVDCETHRLHRVFHDERHVLPVLFDVLVPEIAVQFIGGAHLAHDDLADHIPDVVSLGLLFTRGPCHAVVPVLCGIAQHPLHGQFMPRAFERRFRHEFPFTHLPCLAVPFRQVSVQAVEFLLREDVGTPFPGLWVVHAPSFRVFP